MNKKILVSLSIIGAVAAIAVGGTIAYFSDTETSTGNTFTAGILDLTVSSTGTATDPTCTFANVAGEAVFACNDVKPGDSGESTIKFNLQSNPAWACVYLTNVVDSDNTCTEPELEAESGCTPTGNGELDNSLLLTVWVDDGDGSGIPCNNEKDGTEEVVVSNQPLSSFNVSGDYTLPISVPNGSLMNDPLQPGDHCVGIAWSVSTAAGNDVQSDKLGGDLKFYVEQARNNPNFVCPTLQPQPSKVVGALLSAYVAPESATCNVIVDDSIVGPLDTIQEGVNVATAGQTVCVKAGTYLEDVNVNKSITLAGDGPTLVTLTGVGTGEAGALVVSADGVTVKGFKVIGTGVSAMRISGAHTGDTFSFNDAVAATGKNAFLTDGGQSNHTISNNVFEGNGSQLVYVNGYVDVALPSTNVDFTSNTFGGTATGPLLGISANGSSITLNKFSGTTGYTSIESWEGNNLVNQNNFNVAGQMDIKNGVLGATQFPDTLNAENNWWGDVTPADNVTGLVDFAPFEASAFTEN